MRNVDNKKEREYINKFESLRMSLSHKKYGTEIKRNIKKTNRSARVHYFFILHETLSDESVRFKRKTRKTYFEIPIGFLKLSLAEQKNAIIDNHNSIILNL